MLAKSYLLPSTLVLAIMLGNLSAFSFQQNTKADSLRVRLQAATDTIEVNLLNELARQYWMKQADTAQQYARQGLKEAQQIHYPKGEAEALRILGWSYSRQGNQKQARVYLKRAVRVFEQIGNEPG